MQIILTRNVKDYGKRGEVKDVKPGYYRNFLQPNGLAFTATPNRLKWAEGLMEKAVKQKEDKPYVQLINNGKVEERFIETGQTTQDSVEVKSGLKNGDRILIPNE